MNTEGFARSELSYSYPTYVGDIPNLDQAGSGRIGCSVLPYMLHFRWLLQLYRMLVEYLSSLNLGDSGLLSPKQIKTIQTQNVPPEHAVVAVQQQ